MRARAVIPLRISTGTLTAAALLASLMLWASPAAGDEWSPVDCDQNPDHPGCDVTAETPERPGWTESASGEVACVWDGEQVPCTNDWGWYGGDGCYYQRLDDGPTERDGAPGASYLPQCIGDPPNAQRAAVWIPDSEAPGLGVLAQIAVSRLSLPAPDIALSPPPPAPQLVHLPAWLWVDESTWGPRSATASVPGLSVTATATPTTVVWSTGDGGSRSCEGPGTPWQAGMDPKSESPTCGHTYTRPSRSEPGGVFELSATVTWEITWSGGGTSGTVDPLTTSAGTQVVVTESLSRNTAGGGS